MGRVTCVAEGA
ncbi:hypothetical protein E2C01_079415 [Portunus trituberculatus]|uniref:Uncharacterized protein n=1 Tax=Portunus trituberculatus TaxID=210409 RepID=A0A5B7IJI2_PORTR|nr:hypothetical protein [Portunus trituberculatus]